MSRDLEKSVSKTLDTIESKVDNGQTEQKKRLEEIKNKIERRERTWYWLHIAVTSFISFVISAVFNLLTRGV